MNNVIKVYCTSQKLSIRRFEKMCNLSNGIVGKWYSGKVNPSFKSLQKIERVTGIPVGVMRRERL